MSTPVSLHRSALRGQQLHLDGCIPAPRTPMSVSRQLHPNALHPDARAPTEPRPSYRVWQLGRPGPKVNHLLRGVHGAEATAGGKWQQQRPRELPASPDAEAGRAPTRRIGAPLVFCDRTRADWLSPKNSHPHWLSSPSEPAICCSSCSLEFQPALAVNAREQGIAPAARVAGSLLPLRTSGR